MFKKLRNKFLVLNLTLTVLVMLIAFGSTYVITYRNIMADANIELDRRLEDRGEIPKKHTPPAASSDNGKAPPVNIIPRNQRDLSFSIKADKDGNILSHNSMLGEIGEDDYESLAATVLESGQNEGSFTLIDRQWIFKIQSNNGETVIALMNFSVQNGMLMNLIYIFAFVGGGSLIAIFCISLLFANRAIKPIEQSFDRQTQFISDASHELRTPLATINTNLDVLLASKEDTIEQQQKWIYHIKNETGRMAHLTTSLLALSKGDFDHSKFRFEKIDLSEHINQAILTMEAVIFEKNISLSASIEPHIQIEAMDGQIDQLITIFTDNAVKYTNPRGRIHFVLKAANKHAVLTITNSGEGIRPEDIEKIFDRFYRPDQSRARENGGHGLGLAIAKSIVERHGGKISVQSAVGMYTTFKIELPVQK